MLAINSLAIIYCMIALSALLLTYGEQQKKHITGLLVRTLGFAACLLWPVTLLTVLLTTQQIED
ncbi:MAG: hypothetical protein CML55_09840 [Rhodobacteraceae bacterium]|nr:hypothetical protein [Paracoccaceae bacterium]MBO28769.1 hypothetical protein [Paracoccaceae bacterium]